MATIEKVFSDHAIARDASSQRMLPWIASCAVITGSLDLVFAIVWWAFQGVAPIRIFQSVAAWVVGRDIAINGGLTTAVFGFLVQCGVMALIAALYFRLSRIDARLRQQPLRWGALYGAIAYAIQHLIVVPYFSAVAPSPLPRLDWMLACLIVYVTLVGIPCALFARAFVRDR